MTDATHDPARLSWVASANGHAEFPIQNLPFGVFSIAGDRPRGGVAIGDAVFDIGAALEARAVLRHRPRCGRSGGGAGAQSAARAAGERAAGVAPAPVGYPCGRQRCARQCIAPAARRRCLHAASAGRRRRLHRFLRRHPSRAQGRPDLAPRQSADAELQIRARRLSQPRFVGAAVGRGRATAEGPAQAAERGDADVRRHAAISITNWNSACGSARGNRQDEPIPIGEAAEHIAGFCLLNDWSARDIQSWESQPLGPFLGKSFRTTVSPWIVTAEALEPFRIAQPARPDGDPPPLPHLLDAADQAHGAYDIDCDVFLSTPAMRAAGAEPYRMCRSNTRELYWTVAQMVAHHASNGCNLRPAICSAAAPFPQQMQAASAACWR